MNENDQYLRYEPRTTRVWRRNVDNAMVQLEECLKLFPLIAFDTEYPGTIHRTYLNSSSDEWYSTLKANVESTKLIQCGFTLFNSKGEIGGTWEINFSNFGDPSDTRNEVSIQFLIRHGLDLRKIRAEGVDMFGFIPKLLSAFHPRKHEFVTFQGAYDFAYILCILNSGKLPKTRYEFASEVERIFGVVYDVKVMAGFCEGLGEHMGLSKLAQKLDISRVGSAHHAGSDSLMTAHVFIKLKQVYEDSKFAKGLLYGIGKGNRVTTTTATKPPSQVSVPLMSQQNLVSSYPSSTNLMVHNGYVPSYDHAPVIIWDNSGVPWMFHNSMYVNLLNHHHQIPSSTYAYPTHAADYLGPLPSYYYNNDCFVVE